MTSPQANTAASAWQLQELLGLKFPPTDEQAGVISVPADQQLLVMAGAGAGKTETMSVRMVALVIDGLIDPYQILGLTFTRKAATELQSRVNERLQSLRAAVAGFEQWKRENAAPEDEIRFDLAAQPAPEGYDCKLSATECALTATICPSHRGPWKHPEIRQILSRLQAHKLNLNLPVKVATYDSFAGGLVREYAAYLPADKLPGTLPEDLQALSSDDFRLIGEGERFELMSEVVETWSGDLALPPELLPSRRQLTEMSLRLAGEISSHLVDRSQLAHQVDHLLQALGQDLEQAIETAEESIADKVLDRAKLPQSSKKPEVKDKIAELDVIIRPVLDACEDLQSAYQRMQVLAALLPLVEAFEARKAAENLLEFGDQTALAVQLSHSPEVRQDVRQRYRAVLLDEFQDTSVAQTQLLSQLFSGHGVTAVGDPNQAIYGWRGAAAKSMVRFADHFVPPEAKTSAQVKYLSVSWRNAENILAPANRIAAPLAADLAGTKLQLEVITLQPKPPATDEQGRPLPIDPGVAQWGFYLSDKDEAEAIARYLKAHWYGQANSEGKALTAAILIRSWGQVGALAEALEDLELPYQSHREGGFSDDRGVQLVLDALRVTADPYAGEAMLRLCDKLGLGLADIDALSQRAGRVLSLYEVVRQLGAGEAEKTEDSTGDKVSGEAPLSPAAHQRLRYLNEVLETLQRNSYLPPSDLARLAYRNFGLEIEAALENGATTAAAWDGFCQFITRFENTGRRRDLQMFLNWYDYAAAHEKAFDGVESPQRPECIQIMTIHAAKGLEWDTVVVCGLEEGKLPSLKSRGYDGQSGYGRPESEVYFQDWGWLEGKGDLPFALRGDREDLPQLDLEKVADYRQKPQVLREYLKQLGQRQLLEDRRLVYVALTRARTRLLLTGKKYSGKGNERFYPGMFLQELCPSVRPAAAMLVDTHDRSAGSETDLGMAPQALQSAQEVQEILDLETKNPHSGEVSYPVWPGENRWDSASEAERELYREFQAARAQGQELSELLSAWTGSAPAQLEEAARLAQSLAQWEDRVAAQMPGFILGSVSPTFLSQKPEIIARNKIRPIPQPVNDQAELGNLFHAWAEAELNQDSDSFDLEGLENPVDYDSDLGRQLAHLQHNFRHLEFRADKPTCLGAEVEGALGVVDEQGHASTIVMRMDAILKAQDGTHWIVDWKTGRRPEKTVSAYEKWLVQLGIYRLAYLRQSGIAAEKVRCAYVFLRYDEPAEQVLTLEDICQFLRIGEYSEAELLHKYQQVRAALRDWGWE